MYCSYSKAQLVFTTIFDRLCLSPYGLTSYTTCLINITYLLTLQPSLTWWPRAGSGVVRIDPLRFLAGCRTRRLNQALSVFSLSIGFSSVLLFVRSPFRVFAHLIAPVVTTIYITLSSNKIQNGDILELANPDPPGKWLLKRRDITVFAATFALWPYSALELDDQD